MAPAVRPDVRRLTWLPPALAAAGVVSWHAGRPEPWRDEFATVSVATRSVAGIFALGHHIDGVIVPYYLLLHVWIGWFGDSATAIRLPSILATTATAAVVALLARRWWGDAAGLLGGLLFAILPSTSRYAQEARGYALAALFVALSTLALAGALDKSRWWRWTGYALCVALMGLSHLLSLLVLAGHLIMVAAAVRDAALDRRAAVRDAALDRRAAVRDAGRWRALFWVIAACAGVGAVLPLTAHGLGQQGTQLSWLQTATPDDLAKISGTIFGVPVIGGAVPALGLFALRRSRPAALLWVTVLLPVAVLYAYDQIVGPIFLGRYLLFVVPLLCALAGAGLTMLRPAVAAAVVLVLGLIGLPQQGDIRRAHSSFDYRAAAVVIEQNEQPGDGIVYAPRGGWQLVDIGLSYYLRDRAPRDVLVQRTERQNASLWATECTDPAACLRGTDRVWVVAADNLDPSFRATATNQLSAGEKSALSAYAKSATWRVSGFTITLFTRHPTA